MNSALITLSLSLVFPMTNQDVAESWPQFRGPGGLSLAVGQEPIPGTFGPEKNLLWKVDIPRGYSSPCVQDEQIVLTGYMGEGLNVVFGLDQETGDEIWRTEFRGEEHPSYMHPDARPATPTPCYFDGRWVCYFANYGLVVMDEVGEELWEKRLPHPGYNFGVGNSPLVHEGIIVLPRDGTAEAGILAFDLEDGSEHWTIDRFDCGESHGTPFLWRNSDRTELILSGTTRIGGFDLESGEALWSYTGTTVFPCTTPIADESTLYFAAWSTGNSSGLSFWDAGFGRSLDLTKDEISDPKILFERLDANKDGLIVRDEVPECRAKDAFEVVDADFDGAWSPEELLDVPKGAPGKNVMVAIPKGLDGQIDSNQLRWTHTRGLPYVSSPLLHRGRVWLFKAGGLVTCLDAETGKVAFGPVRLPDRAEYYASPVGAGDSIIACSAEGSLYLIDANADELKITHSVNFESEIFATPAVISGTVYLRTNESMWAFGQDGEG